MQELAVVNGAELPDSPIGGAGDEDAGTEGVPECREHLRVVSHICLEDLVLEGAGTPLHTPIRPTHQQSAA